MHLQLTNGEETDKSNDMYSTDPSLWTALHKKINNKHIHSSVMLDVRHMPPRAEYRGLCYVFKNNEDDIKWVFFPFFNESKTD